MLLVSLDIENVSADLSNLYLCECINVNIWNVSSEKLLTDEFQFLDETLKLFQTEILQPAERP